MTLNWFKMPESFQLSDVHGKIKLNFVENFQKFQSIQTFIFVHFTQPFSMKI